MLLAPCLARRSAVWAAPANAKSASQAARAALFAHLEKGAGAEIKLPDFPQEKLLVWVDRRNAAVAADPKARYALLGEHLLIARKLLDGDDLAARKRGYWIASESANFAGAKLKDDKWLLARIYETFLLPKIALANVELWQDPSRSRILEAGVSAFGNAGEADRQIRVLEWLLSIGEKTPDQTDAQTLMLQPNTLDWARGTLASLLAAPPDANRPDLERALKLFEAIQSPDMKGFKHLELKVKKRLEKLDEPVASE